MVDNRETLNITGGMDVFGSDGEKVGSVSGVEGDYMVVSKGFFFPTDYYIPTSAIESAGDDGVYLNVTRDEALNQGWDAVPETTAYSTDQATTAQGTFRDGGTYTDPSAGEYVDANDATLDNTSARTTDTATTGDTINVPVTEEELVAGTRDVERGSVQVDRVVSEEQQSVDVPVTEERVHVSRHAVDRDVNADEASFEEGTIEIPVKGQDVAVGKRTRVTEEVEIGKEAVQDTQRVTDTVRRQDVRVTDNTDGTVVDNAEGVGENTWDNAGNQGENLVDKAKNKAKDTF